MQSMAVDFSMDFSFEAKPRRKTEEIWDFGGVFKQRHTPTHGLLSQSPCTQPPRFLLPPNPFPPPSPLGLLLHGRALRKLATGFGSETSPGIRGSGFECESFQLKFRRRVLRGTYS